MIDTKRLPQILDDGFDWDTYCLVCFLRVSASPWLASAVFGWIAA
ncbi:MAG: hypothetical protein ACOYKN_19560 [Pirellula sp.]